MDKDRAKGWWAGVERPRKIMLAATALLFVSQFFRYGEKTAYFLTDATNTSLYTGMASADSPASGWSLHPHALPVILVLAAAFGAPLARRAGVRGWIYWAGAALVFLAVIPAAPMRGVGAMMGLVAVGLAVWAALAARKAPAPLA